MHSGNPFIYMFKESDWFARFLATIGFFILTMIIMMIAFVIVLIPVGFSMFRVTGSGDVTPTAPNIAALGVSFVLLIAIALIVSGIVYGYMIQIVDNIMQGADKILPRWTDNFGRRTWHGIVFGVVAFIWSLPSTVLSALDPSRTATTGSAGFAPEITLFGTLSFLYNIFFLLILPVIIGRFATSRSFVSAFRVDRIFSTFGGNIGKYLLAFLFQIGAIILIVVLMTVVVLAVIPVSILGGGEPNLGLGLLTGLGVFLVMLFIGTYFFYVIAGIYGFANRDVIEKEGPALSTV